METAARFLIVAGLLLVLAGVLAYGFAKLGIGRLPGDLVWRRGRTTVYVPLASMLLLSVLLTLLLNLLLRR